MSCRHRRCGATGENDRPVAYDGNLSSSPCERAKGEDDEADAFVHSLKRTYDDCIGHSNRVRRYPDGRAELDVMWSAVKLIENQFAEAGFAPR
jgi:hypothetical protein